VKTGIFITARNSSEGGGYTISYDILNNLLYKINKNNKDSFYFILVNDNDNFIKKKLISKNIEFTDFKQNKTLSNFINFIFCICPLLHIFYRFCNLDKFYNLEKKKNIAIVWYLSAEYSYPFFKNYIATLWDLMHITDTQFPEVGNFNIKFYRSIVLKRFLKKSTKIITGSDYLIKILNKIYDIGYDKIIKAPHPTPTVFLKKKISKVNNKIGNFFLYPANFWQHKNHKNLIKGFNLFNIEQNLKYKLVLCGSINKDVNYYNDCLNLINSTQSKNNIIILDFINLNKLINLYDSCKALVYASNCGPENLPPLEAFARNKPVLCSKYIGAKEQLKNYPIYFSPKNISSIFNSFKFFIRNNNLRGKDFRKFSESRNIKYYIDDILNCIDNYKSAKLNTIVLGLNVTGHGDSSACLVKNGKLVSAVEEERFTKLKHCSNFPINSIKYCLANSNITLDEVDYISVNYNSHSNYIPKIIYFIKNIFNKSIYKNLYKNFNRNKNIISKFYFYFNTNVSKKLNFTRHHLAHVFSTFFFTNKNNNSLIYSFDGSGDFSTFEIYLVKKSKYKLINSNHFPHSLGFLYTAFTQFIGFSKYGDEYKIMGLSAYGRPIYVEKINKLIERIFPLKLNLKYLNFPKISNVNGMPITSKIYNKEFINLLGKPRLPLNDNIKQIYKDYAASIQKVFENIVLTHLKILKAKYGSDKLYLTGGCAFNGLLINKIIESNIFKEVNISCNPGDAGGSVGSAFQLLYKKKLYIDENNEKTFLGPSYSNEYIAKEIINKLVAKKNYKIKFYNNFNNLASRAAKILKEEKIIFWFQDKMEWGPRALGNRSILADPRGTDIKDFINKKIKKRELFRPFAPAVLKELANEYFYMNKKDSPYMNIIFKAKENTKKFFPGVVHVDGTSRVQTVSNKENKKFYILIKKFYKITNCPIVVNTSLNIDGPIALTPTDAFNFFLESKTKYIVLNNWLIKLNK
jgi:carbamoyltransferase